MAGAQGGAISHAQLRAAGMSTSAIGRRIARGDLNPRHDGVHALGRPLDGHGETWAAALAAGERGALTRWSAAAVIGVAPWPPVPEIVVVGGGLSLVDVRVHRTRSLPQDEIYLTRDGLPFTWWPRTITDLAAHSSIAELQSVLDGLHRCGLLDVEVAIEGIRRARGRSGLRKLHAALEPFTTIPDAEFLSLLERFAATILHRAGVTGYEINGRVELGTGRTIRVDILFRAAHVAVEVDGRETHDRPGQMEVDRRRDRGLQTLGFVVPRFHWTDVVHRPAIVLEDILAGLRRPRVA